MDEYTDEVSLEDTTEEPSADGIDESVLRKLKQENHSLRQRLRRTELDANFGKDVVELIPEELPLSKWEEYAGRLAERLPQRDEPKPNEQAAEEPSQEDEPAGLAAVASASVPGATLPEDLKTVAETKELAKTDPVKANELRVLCQLILIMVTDYQVNMFRNIRGMQLVVTKTISAADIPLTNR